MENTTLSPPLCSKCGSKRTWYKDSGRKAGGVWRCKECLKPFYRARYEAKHEEMRAEYRARYEANPEKYRAKTRAHYWANTEKCLAAGRIRRSAWEKTNPEKCSAKARRRRARKRAATSPLCKVTDAVIAERFALTKGCAYCGADAKLTLDHVVALNDGGLHVPSNLVGACSTCNSSKHASPVEEWYRSQPFFSEQRWQRIQEITGQGQLSLI